MIQLKRVGENVELTDKKSTVIIDAAARTIKIANHLISDTGEYEIGGVEVIYGNDAALLVWEHVQIVTLFSLYSPSAFEKEQFSACSVLLVPKLNEPSAKGALDQILQAYNPDLIVCAPGSLSEDYLGSLKASAQNTLKLSSATLPQEGRETVVLE